MVTRSEFNSICRGLSTREIAMLLARDPYWELPTGSVNRAARMADAIDDLIEISGEDYASRIRMRKSRIEAAA